MQVFDIQKDIYFNVLLKICSGYFWEHSNKVVKKKQTNKNVKKCQGKGGLRLRDLSMITKCATILCGANRVTCWEGKQPDNSGD